ncbi:metallopeptidase TldD-related protein [Roseateles toxinivorans]|uniref:Putative Zn-dependent protease n=1 Tax=Roseateles toxinivorans TaxID=270368 RepID=A0A4R6QIM6_9BURK|nr:metallopeptidase TldD-related protein [Roseateles toxinivorans]TDP62462.1 putative Zn-dependent protease [Roseateles toxinivorans]
MEKTNRLSNRLQDAAEQALALMRAQGFDQAQVSASAVVQDELNIAHNHASLMRSTESQKLSLLGLIDGRKASTELTEFGVEGLRERIASLFADASGAPQDAANAVSSGQRANIVQGPQQGDVGQLADTVAELLAFRERETPLMMLDEGAAAHLLAQSHTVTSEGSELSCSLGWYSLSAFGTAREGKQSSSFNYAGGNTDDLRALPAAEHFGIGEMLRDTSQQIHTRPIDGNFVGEVLLTPPAVADLLAWLQGQLSDMQLINGSSLYRDQVGAQIASPHLSLRSRFDAPGVAAISGDAFATPPLEVLREGRLLTLTPSLYASRKTGLPHVPVAGSGWEIAAGQTSRAELLGAMPRGAVVGRLSMGNPAPNGDFSGVIKNSFGVQDGLIGPALSEVMITGNIATMLREVRAVSRERIDTGALLLPWLRIAGLHFS